MTSITPCLWFDRQGEEAANFYVSLLPNSRIDSVQRSPADYPNGKAGDALMVSFTLDGRPFSALNGGPQAGFTEAVSMQVIVEGQAEVDRLWNGLSADGGAPGQCGWLKDKYGLSWQIVPKELMRLLGDGDRGRARRAMQAMMDMTRIDIAILERAADAA
jgi:predicted 3-demethylubiquinone-9 3-methyltransferase (glyoxalase superfamily)